MNFRVIGRALVAFALPVVACHDAAAPDPNDPNLAADLRFVAGTAQRGEAGTRMPEPVVVRLATADGRAIAGQSVHLAVSLPAPQQASAVTDRNGYASFRLSFSRVAGSMRLQASWSRPTGTPLYSSVIQNVVSVAGAPHRVTAHVVPYAGTEPATYLVGRGDVTTVHVYGVDSLGNAAPLPGAASWSSTDTSVATVDAGGRVTSRALGEVTVNAATALGVASVRLLVMTRLVAGRAPIDVDRGLAGPVRSLAASYTGWTSVGPDGTPAGTTIRGHAAVVNAAGAAWIVAGADVLFSPAHGAPFVRDTSVALLTATHAERAVALLGDQPIVFVSLPGSGPSTGAPLARIVTRRADGTWIELPLPPEPRGSGLRLVSDAVGVPLLMLAEPTPSTTWRIFRWTGNSWSRVHPGFGSGTVLGWAPGGGAYVRAAGQDAPPMRLDAESLTPVPESPVPGMVFVEYAVDGGGALWRIAITSPAPVGMPVSTRHIVVDRLAGDRWERVGMQDVEPIWFFNGARRPMVLPGPALWIPLFTQQCSGRHCSPLWLNLSLRP